MTKKEINLLLEYAQNFDNRKITDGMVDAWQEVLGGLSFEVARAAVVEAFKSEDVKWLEPKHVYRYARPLIERQRVIEDRVKTIAEMQSASSSPMPKCQHGVGLLYCVPCCKTVGNR